MLKQLIVIIILLFCCMSEVTSVYAQNKPDNRPPVQIPQVLLSPVQNMFPTVLPTSGVVPSTSPSTEPTEQPQTTEVPTDILTPTSEIQPTQGIPAILLTPTRMPTFVPDSSQSIPQFFQNQPILSPFGITLFTTPNFYAAGTRGKLESVTLLIVALIYFFAGFALLDSNTFLKVKAIKEKVVFHKYKMLTFPILRNFL